MTQAFTAGDLKKALRQQQNEINDFTIYTVLAALQQEDKNKKIFEKIAREEQQHYHFWVGITQRELSPQHWLVMWYVLLVKLLGTSFALKSLEKKECGAEQFYKELFDIYPQAKTIYHQEINHELELIDMLHDKKLLYTGAIVLGMNDALVELTGTLSGIALAFDKTLVVGATGLIMGIAASLSMAGSAYLESKENPNPDISALSYSAYTGVSYILTTAVLVLPFFVLQSMVAALALMFVLALIAIVLYTFYISVAKDLSFKSRVLEMSSITFGVAIISFFIGYAVKYFLGVEI
ncbi:VIT1/CCC1 transporter family protein [Shewanella dokdonensis]|uniref:VIT1/CCC1 transporter family protein n=1 Tax=Shewanella dokdonensis TaxID=712036 RepID=UPI00200E9F3D|nr:VIT1/CCC1 family protein [Shewanella dokdonensis]MCL1074378.1 VIT1/CCC1 family protein [Shewanella dokdonensis]